MSALIKGLYIVKHWFGDVIFRRVFKNAGFLMSGKLANGLLGLIYFGLAAHGLGVKQFGILILVQTYIQVITGITTFQSWQAVIRYGAICLEQKDVLSLQKLIKFTSLLDVAGVAVGAIIAYMCAPLIASYVGWSEEVVAYARPYSFLILFTIVATPTGILRLNDRFDLLAIQAVVPSMVRVIGVVIAYFLDAPFWAYLLAWFVAGMVGGLTLLVMGWLEALRQGWLYSLTFSLSNLTSPHRGIVKFSIVSNLHSSLLIVPSHMSTFLIGIVATPTAAGLFKVAREMATALTKPAELLTQSIYPEFARLGGRDSWQDFARLIIRSTIVAGSLGLVVLIVIIVLGKTFLSLAFGPEFVSAYWVLVLLVAAATLTIAAFGLDPAMYAMGRPSIPLTVNTIVILAVYLPVLIVLTPRMGPAGAGVAMLISSILTVISMSLMTVVVFSRRAERR